MSNVFYDGGVVESVVSRISQISNSVPGISSGIRSATNKIISAKGFQQYVGGISSDSFSGAVDKCQDSINTFSNEIRQKQVTILAYSEDSNAINSFLNGLSVSDFNNLDLTELNSYIGLDRKAGNILKGVGSTLATFGISIFEGLGNLLETGADLVVLGTSAAATLFTSSADLITGGHLTSDMWEETRAFVSDKKVENIFNSFYNDTEVGQSLKNNAYGFDTTRSIGSGLGYTAGIIGLNVLTGGVASGLGVGAAGSITPVGLATSAGLLGIASGTEDAWNDGATIQAGLLFGLANGVWEGAQWYAGAKINQYNGLGDKIAQGIFKGAAKGVGTRVAMDMGVAGVDSFVRPALSMIYKDYGQGNFIDNYQSAFAKSGGWKSVGTHVALGGIASAVGEYFGARRLLKAANADDGVDDAAREVFSSDGGDGSSEFTRIIKQNVDSMAEENGKRAIDLRQLDDELSTVDDDLLRRTKIDTIDGGDADLIFAQSNDGGNSGGFLSKFRKKQTVDLSQLDDEFDALNKELLEKTKVPTIDASSADAKMIFGEATDGSSVVRSTLSQADAEDLFRAKYGDAYKVGVDYTVKVDSSGRAVVEWLDYESYVSAHNSSLSNYYYSLDDMQRAGVQMYVSGDGKITYQSLNGIVRGNLFEYDASGKISGVKLHGLKNNVESSLDDFFQGESVSEVLSSNKRALLDIDSSIRGSALQEDVISYRGVKTSATKSLFGFDSEMMESMTDEEIRNIILQKEGFTTNGFFSTSVTKEATPLKDSTITYVITNREGTPALDMVKFGGYPNEQELLVAGCTPYKYTDVEISGTGINRNIKIFCETDPNFDMGAARKQFVDTVESRIGKLETDFASSGYVPSTTYYDSNGIYHSANDIDIPKVAYNATPSYNNAPTFSDTPSMVRYIQSGASGGTIDVDSAVGIINKHLDNVGGTSGGVLKELSSMSDLGFSPTQQTQIIREVVNSNQVLREQISNATEEELKIVLGRKYGITDSNTVQRFKNIILGNDFVESGSIGIDGGKLSSFQEGYVKDYVQTMVGQGQEPVLCGNFPKPSRTLMDQKYVTLSNSTVGDITYVDTMYGSAVSRSGVKNVFDDLSTPYVQACCEAVDASGQELSSLKYLYSSDVDVTDAFDYRFRSRELPEIVSYGSVEKITLAKTNPVTLEIESTVDIDLSDLVYYYDSNYTGGNVYEDPGLCSKLYEMFMKKVKEALK